MTRDAMPVSPGLDRVAVLERRIGASLERVWENVLDWEHLPWLHRTDFACIALQDAGDWGWRARAESTSRPGEPFVIELLVDREAGHYVSRTVAGTGAGSEIWTALDPVADDETDIRVEFWLPGVPEASRDRVGAGYLRLYERLWDEDESMMRERTIRLDERARRKARATPAPAARLELGRRTELLSRLPLCVELGEARWRLVALDDELHVHDARCPHLLGPLTDEPEEAEPGQVECPWHGYRFDVRTGRSSDGRRLRLRKPPRIEHDATRDDIALVLD